MRDLEYRKYEIVIAEKLFDIADQLEERNLFMFANLINVERAECGGLN